MPNTVVLGLGFATLRPSHGPPAMTVADVDGVILAGLLFDAGDRKFAGSARGRAGGSKARHAEEPDQPARRLLPRRRRRGGPGAPSACRINSADTIVDHTWIWRADHGSGVGWKSNTAANGLVVNGSQVTIYGLFVEHYQEYQVLWNGERGRVYFYQSEIPYDPPDQPSLHERGRH